MPRSHPSRNDPVDIGRGRHRGAPFPPAEPATTTGRHRLPGAADRAEATERRIEPVTDPRLFDLPLARQRPAADADASVGVHGRVEPGSVARERPPVPPATGTPAPQTPEGAEPVAPPSPAPVRTPTRASAPAEALPWFEAEDTSGARRSVGASERRPTAHERRPAAPEQQETAQPQRSESRPGTPPRPASAPRPAAPVPRPAATDPIRVVRVRAPQPPSQEDDEDRAPDEPLPEPLPARVVTESFTAPVPVVPTTASRSLFSPAPRRR